MAWLSRKVHGHTSVVRHSSLRGYTPVTQKYGILRLLEMLKRFELEISQWTSRTAKTSVVADVRKVGRMSSLEL